MKRALTHSNSTATTSPKTGKELSGHKSGSTKFIPNLTQLQEAVQELPDPEEWNEKNYIHLLAVDDKKKPVEFVRKRITRGSKRPYRWIYEGKVLIRKRDV